MEQSIFFEGLGSRERTPVVSYLLLEILSVVIEVDTEVALDKAITMSLIKIGFDQSHISGSVIVGVANRIAEIQEQDAKSMASLDSKPPVTSITSKSFGQDYIEFVEKSSTADKCLMACGWDYNKANYLYSKVDKAIADQIIANYVLTRWNELKTNFEACVFGFGGGFGKPTEGLVYDMTTKAGKNAAASQMKSMGF